MRPGARTGRRVEPGTRGARGDIDRRPAGKVEALVAHRRAEWADVQRAMGLRVPLAAGTSCTGKLGRASNSSGADDEDHNQVRTSLPRERARGEGETVRPTVKLRHRSDGMMSTHRIIECVFLQRRSEESTARQRPQSEQAVEEMNRPRR